MRNIISIKNLSISFKNSKKVVDSINIDIPRGKTVAIVGESGSGKTLTALSILKLLPNSANIDSGKIIYNNKNILELESSKIEKIRGNKITTIFQEPMTSLNPLHTINKQIEEIILTHQNISSLDSKRKTISLLAEVGLHSILNRQKLYSYELSGGQRQRVMIAMSIANNPDLLIADEPTTALDVTVQIQILELLKKLQIKLGMSILFISHDLAIVNKMADYVYIMKSGKIIENDNKNTIFSEAKNSYTKKLISYHHKIRVSKKLDAENIIEVKNLKVWYPIKKGLFKTTYSYVKAINNLSFTLKKKETLGIVGESGSGKTSLVLAILKLIESKGKINIDGEDLHLLKKKDMLGFRKKIQIIFQDPFSSLSPRMTIKEIILEGLNIHFHYLNTSEKLIRVKNILKEVGLDYEENLNKYPHEFSGGQRQRIAIARALILNPKLLILDEPTSALDVSIQNQIINLLNKLQEKYNLTYIFISHNMKVIRAVADKIIVLKDGVLVENNISREIFKNPKNKYTQNLIRSVI